MNNEELTMQKTENALKQKSYALSIANKEANETQYWIRLLIDSEVIESEKGETILNKCIELVKILTASIKTPKSKR